MPLRRIPFKVRLGQPSTPHCAFVYLQPLSPVALRPLPPTLTPEVSLPPSLTSCLAPLHTFAYQYLPPLYHHNMLGRVHFGVGRVFEIAVLLFFKYLCGSCLFVVVRVLQCYADLGNSSILI